MNSWKFNCSLIAHRADEACLQAINECILFSFSAILIFSVLIFHKPVSFRWHFCLYFLPCLEKKTLSNIFYFIEANYSRTYGDYCCNLRPDIMLRCLILTSCILRLFRSARAFYRTIEFRLKCWRKLSVPEAYIFKYYRTCASLIYGDTTEVIKIYFWPDHFLQCFDIYFLLATGALFEPRVSY